ncbi:MAG: Gfo/Idh/MocA family oxidoreductase [Defluviitaleaceae bacterium]|nr:Gfo/Idh/MocA family oxidoreductase [Defluviitaleaceae bacterium]
MQSKKKIAVLGGGGILGAHAPGFTRLTELCEVVAVAEKNPANYGRVRELLKKDVEFYDCYKKALDHPGLDAVDILLPHSLHCDAAVQAAKKGLHVLCEKVMARNTYECQEMVDASKKAGVELVVAHDRRYADGWIKLKEIIDSGVIGEILFIKMDHNQDVNCPEDSWIRQIDCLGGGAVMSCLTHQIDALRWYAGEAVSVNCMTKTVPSRMEGECIGAVTAQMESGALALLSLNWLTRSHTGNNCLWYESNHICGTLGEAYFMSGRGTYKKIYGVSDDFHKIESASDLSGHQKCIEEFIKKICGLPSSVLTYGCDSLKTVEIAEAAYISEATGKNVILPIVRMPWDERSYKRCE